MSAALWTEKNSRKTQGKRWAVQGFEQNTDLEHGPRGRVEDPVLGPHRLHARTSCKKKVEIARRRIGVTGTSRSCTKCSSISHTKLPQALEIRTICGLIHPDPARMHATLLLNELFGIIDRRIKTHRGEDSVQENQTIARETSKQQNQRIKTKRDSRWGTLGSRLPKAKKKVVWGGKKEAACGGVLWRGGVGGV